MITDIPFSHREQLELEEYKSLREEVCSKQETGTHFLHITIGGICAILALVSKDIFEYVQLLLDNDKGQLSTVDLMVPLTLPIVLLAVGIPVLCLLSVYHLKQERQWLDSIIDRVITLEDDLTQDGNFKFWEQCVKCTKSKYNSCGDRNCYLYMRKAQCSRYNKLSQETNYYHNKVIPLIFFVISVSCQALAYFLVCFYIVPNVIVPYAIFSKPDFSMIIRNLNFSALGLGSMLLIIIVTWLFFHRIYIAPKS